MPYKGRKSSPGTYQIKDYGQRILVINLIGLAYLGVISSTVPVQSAACAHDQGFHSYLKLHGTVAVDAYKLVVIKRMTLPCSLQLLRQQPKLGTVGKLYGYCKYASPLKPVLDSGGDMVIMSMCSA